jgi:hypothetical protein
MNKLPWILFGLALLGVIYAFVLLLNAGSALDSARSEAARQRERSGLALSIIRKEWVGKDAEGVVTLSREFEKQGVVVGTEDGSLEIGDLIFEIKQGSVTDVRYID